MLLLLVVYRRGGAPPRFLGTDDGTGGESTVVNMSIYRTHAQYCGELFAKPSANGAIARIPIPGPPAYWFVPPVPDFLDNNRLAAATGGWGTDLGNFYGIYERQFEGWAGT